MCEAANGFNMSDANDQREARRRAAAARALKEAEERRASRTEVERDRELGGRAGPDPVRHGDWENRGIASDF